MKLFKNAVSYGGHRCDVCHIDAENFEGVPDELILKAHAVCFNNGKMLLVNHSEWDIWGIPGGTRELGESLEQTLKREIEEETNCRIINCFPISYQKVISPDNKIYYGAQYICNVEPIDEFKTDPAGNIKKILWINPCDYYKYIEKKEFKEIILQRALSVFNKSNKNNKNMNDSSHTILIPYQPLWKEKFETEKTKLLEIFGDKAIAIEHIGSTSIPELSAKPIIDIAVLIEKREDGDGFIGLVEKFGYLYDKLNSSGERHLFKKGNPTEFHLSIAYKDKGSFWERQILFRDYLRKHSDVRNEYQKLKKDLLKDDPSGKGNYLSGKSEFVGKILSLA